MSDSSQPSLPLAQYVPMDANLYSTIPNPDREAVQSLLENSHLGVEGAKRVCDFFQQIGVPLQILNYNYLEGDKVITKNVVFAWHIGGNKNPYLPGRTLEMFICNCSGTRITQGMSPAAAAVEDEVVRQVEDAGLISEGKHDPNDPNRVNNVQRLIVVPTEGMGSFSMVTSFAKGEDIKFARHHDALMERFGIQEWPPTETHGVGAVFLLPVSQAKSWVKAGEETAVEYGIKFYAKWTENDIKNDAKRKPEEALNAIFGTPKEG